MHVFMHPPTFCYHQATMASLIFVISMSPNMLSGNKNVVTQTAHFVLDDNLTATPATKSWMDGQSEVVDSDEDNEDDVEDEQNESNDDAMAM